MRNKAHFPFQGLLLIMAVIKSYLGNCAPRQHIRPSEAKVKIVSLPRYPLLMELNEMKIDMKDRVLQLIEGLSNHAFEDLEGLRMGGWDIEEAISLLKKPRPKSLFKYRANDARSRENLKKDMVWLSRPSAYNDPYDSCFSIAHDPASRLNLAEAMARYHEADGDEKEAQRIRTILKTPSRELHSEGLEDMLAHPSMRRLPKLSWMPS